MSGADLHFLSRHSAAMASVSQPNAAVLSISDLAMVAATIKFEISDKLSREKGGLLSDYPLDLQD
jgi:hypothetical protein